MPLPSRISSQPDNTYLMRDTRDKRGTENWTDLSSEVLDMQAWLNSSKLDLGLRRSFTTFHAQSFRRLSSKTFCIQTRGVGNG